MRPKISFVVLTMNSQKTLARCLKSIRSQDISKEIIVVDGGSNDNSVAIAKKLEVDLVMKPYKNIAEARNAGIQQAIGEYLAFVDSDIVIPPEWSNRMLDLMENSPFANERLAGCSCAFTTHPKNWVTEAFDMNRNYIEGTRFVDFLYLQSSLLKTDIVKQYQIDTKLNRTGEDQDLYYQMTDDGWLFMHTDTVKVMHLSKTSLLGIMSRYATYGYSVPYVMLKHNRFNYKHLLMMLFWIFVYGIVFTYPEISLLVFISPYALYFMDEKSDFSLQYSIVNGLKFKAQCIGMLLGLYRLYKDFLFQESL